jgi:hypothetical protein
VGYDDSGNRIPYYVTSTPASGELYTSARDLARFAMFHLKNHGTVQSRILDDQQIDELHKPVFSGPSSAATTFGWFSAHRKSGRPVLFKAGGQPGVANLMYIVPSENLACLVLTNRSDGREFAFSLCDQMLAIILADWTRPDENVAPPHSAFVATPDFAGRWVGTLTDGGANMRAELKIAASGTASLSLGDKPAEKLVDAQLEDTSLTANSVGIIESPDAIRNEATSLSVKLIPQGARLVGRVLATAKKPGALLPYVLRLDRVVS